MNFFESQDRARTQTSLLVLLFTLAIVTLIIMVNLLVMLVFGYLNGQQMQEGGTFFQQMDWQTTTLVSAAVAAVLLVGSLYKIAVLSAGGKVVAETLGGKLIPQNTNEIGQRKLLNVVEEMAIASGIPAPPVYLLADEAGINAFAAGFSPRDAVIGVTQGTIEHLDREQLQGVIAHEFSHIFNGDMRLNIRLIGVLNGILILGIIGYYLLYSASFSRHGRSNNKNAGGIVALAIGLMVIGFAGTFFGGLIKAAVSRQREYLADASAVQFTRNPDGIAGALKEIGSLEFGSKLENPAASEISHALFAQGVSGFMQSMSATHPPLAERILRIDPHWNGQFTSSRKTDSAASEEELVDKESMTREQLANKVTTIAASTVLSSVANSIDQIGNPKPETIDFARALIAELPTDIKEAAREPYGARAIIYSLALDSGEVVRARQLIHLQVHADPAVSALTQELRSKVTKLDIKFRLPILDIAIPALKQLSPDQYKTFKSILGTLIEMDYRVDLLEWSLQKILFNHLDEYFFKPTHGKKRYYQVAQLKLEISLVLSVLADAGQQDQAQIEEAFDAATKILELKGLVLLAQNEISFSELDLALQKLEMLCPLHKQKLLKACAASILFDQKISAVEVEILRAFADALGCPMPLTVIL